MSGTSRVRSRRRRDLLIAGVIALVTLSAGFVIYLRSDARATTLDPGPAVSAPATMTTPPASLDQVWALTTSPSLGAVVSPYGSVVTADEHTVTGHNAVTGLQEWSYGRSNLPLCVLASGDTRPDTEVTASGAVRGVVTGYVKSGHCSEITSLNPITGERLDQRTGFTGQDSTAVFGGPYGGFVSDDLVELWRYDLVRTIQYGNQPEPTKPNTKHLGCTFVDVALAATQFGTIEHCPDSDAGPDAQLVLNYDDPGASADAKSKSWDYLNFDPRTTVDLKSEHARLLAVTSEQAAVLVASPEPAVVVYDATGAEISRRVVSIPTEQIVAADSERVTPTVIGTDARYTLVGTTLFAVSTSNLDVLWTLPDVLGTPALAGSSLLVATAGGIAVVPRSTGVVTTTLPLDRAGYQGQVDVGVIGNTVVETRGSAVLGFRDPNAPATDPPLSTSTSSTGFRIPSRTTGSTAGTTAGESTATPGSGVFTDASTTDASPTTG